MYDYLVVGAGLFGSVFAHEAHKRGKSVLVLERRPHIGGNCYTEVREGIPVHIYGPHCFHTGSKRIWDYINQFAEFNNFSLRVKANYEGRVFSLPINLMTLQQLWGVTTPEVALQKLEAARVPCENPRNLEDWALSQVGEEIYRTFFYGYTAKQWGREPKDLPASIIRRLPIRLNYNDRYYADNHRWEGIPIGGYTPIFEKLLDGVEVRLNSDVFEALSFYTRMARKIVYSGPIDEFFDFCYGPLEYRSLRWEHEVLDIPDYQGCAQMNYTERDITFTRIIEHKHFEFLDTPKTIITREYPVPYNEHTLPLYPVNDEKNNAIYARYKELADKSSVIFGGRLARYQYYDMDQTIANALAVVEREFAKE